MKSAIEQLLDSGQWPPDSQVPSERRLCEQFQISRITVRQALAELVREGRLIRSHGRGTFVAQAQLRKPVFPLVSFTQDVREHGMQPGAKVLLFEATQPPPHVMANLRLGVGDKMLLPKRLRLANGKPMAVETVYLPSRRFGLLDENLELRSSLLYETLTKNTASSRRVRTSSGKPSPSPPTPDCWRSSVAARCSGSNKPRSIATAGRSNISNRSFAATNSSSSPS